MLDQRDARPANQFQDTAAKAIRWGISEMGLDLTVDGRECPGCNSTARFCLDTKTEINLPLGVNNQDLVDMIQANLGPGEKAAVGLDSSASFYLDVAQLPQLNSNNVLGLLTATSAALHRRGTAVDLGAAMTAAQNILSE